MTTSSNGNIFSVTGPLWGESIGHRLLYVNLPSVRWHAQCVVSIDSASINGNWRLAHWGRVTHMCVSKLTTIGSDNGLSPDRRQAIIWTNAGILLIGPLETKFNEILIKFHTSSFKKMHLKLSSGNCRPFCLGLNVLTMISTLWNVVHVYNTLNVASCFLL